MKYGVLLAFLLLAIVQWMIPVKTIWEKDQVLKRGHAHKFRTEPVDPSHPFKGKYITLNFTNSLFSDTVNRDLGSNDDVYVILQKDIRGFSIIKDLSIQEPQNTDDYVSAVVYYVSREKDTVTVHLQYPFDEFYLDEYKAPKAESIYRESTRDTSNTTYALVKILKGEAVIENVFINDIPIGSLIK